MLLRKGGRGRRWQRKLDFRWIAAVAVIFYAQVASVTWAEWWEHPHDRWYFKDDWKGSAVDRYSIRLRLRNPAVSGWMVIWGDAGVVLRVEGQEVMRHVDRGLIYDSDVSGLVRGRSEIAIESGPGKIVAEGEIIDAGGLRYPFASGCDWPSPAEEGVVLRGAAHPYRPGEASGAFNSAHNGLLLRYNAEERGKTDISKALARIQKVREQSIFLLRRYRPVEDILNFSGAVLWRKAEEHAEAQLLKAEEMIQRRAIPLQKSGRFSEASGLSAEAGAWIGSAELAIGAARELEESERMEKQIAGAAWLIARSGKPVPPREHALELVRQELVRGRSEADFSDWAGVEKRARLARMELGRLAEELEKIWGGPIGKLDEFPDDGFGWFNSMPLMGNDPARWEFTLAPEEAGWIDLSGRWDFRVDPAHDGEKEGWSAAGMERKGWRSLRVPGAWERQGVQQENDHSPWDCPYPLKDLRCDDKPYNGYAWYRRELRVPESWRGQRVILELGKVSNWLRLFVNGRLIEERANGGKFLLPAGTWNAGETNIFAVEVYNHDNFGGLVEGPIGLGVEGRVWAAKATPGPLSFANEVEARGEGGARQHWTTVVSAMSPAVLIGTDRAQIDVSGWEAKGFGLPDRLRFDGGGSEWGKMDLGKKVMERSGGRFDWVLLDAAASGSEERLIAPRPVLLRFSERPEAMEWGTNRLGFARLRFRFKSPGVKAAVLRFTGDSAPSLEECRRWAARMAEMPESCTELGRLDETAHRGIFYLKYHYAEWAKEGGARFAPVPQLLSYGLDWGHRDLDLASNAGTNGAVEVTGYRSELARFRCAPGAEWLSYSVPLPDQAKVLKGIGELFAKRRPEENARGGNSEAQMFDDWKEWGFDHCRYAFAWNQDWDIPLQRRLGGPVSEDSRLWERMDQLVEEHSEREIMAMLCYFFNEDQPQADSRKLVRNSTRYWQMHPETRTNAYALWRRIAERYKGLPAGAVAYDFFNEPAYMHQEDWNRIIRDLTRLVREVDRVHLIVCEAGDGWSQPEWFSWLQPTGDTNTIYSFHHYGKHWGYDYDEYYPGYKSTPERQADAILEAVLFGIRHQVPMHCGEFGVSMISPGDDHLVWLDDYLGRLERFGIGWNWWNWDGAGIYRTGLKAGNEVSSNLKVLRKWIDRRPAESRRWR